MDGDFQHKPKDILKLISCFEKNKADMVIGTRNLFKKNDKSLSFFKIKRFKDISVICKFLSWKKNKRSNEWFFYF